MAYTISLICWVDFSLGRIVDVDFAAKRQAHFRLATILAALGNAALLLVATGGLLLEATQRLSDAPAVASKRYFVSRP